MSNELEGRALAEAAARAMGWTIKLDDRGTEGDLYGADGKWRGPTVSNGCHECGGDDTGWPTERECLAWLRQRGDLELHIGPNAMQAWHHGAERNCRYGYELGETLQRLVVAVAAREQAAKGEP